MSTCLCLHAEENALLEAGRERIREGAILYCDTWAKSLPAFRPILLTQILFSKLSVFDMHREDCASRDFRGSILARL